MSTETIEAPKGTSVLDDLNIIPSPEHEKPEGEPAVETPIPEPPKEPKQEPVTPEPPKEEPVPEIKGKAREHFARLEAAKKEVEEQKAKLQQDYEAAQAHLKELEEKTTQFNPEDFQKQIEERDQKLQQMQSELKFVALERDPDFVARYDKPRELLKDSLKEMAEAASIDGNQFERAFKLGLNDQLDEIRESLPSHQQRRWDAALNQIEQVQLQKELALKNRDQTYEEIAKTRYQAQEQRVNQITSQNLQIARKVAAEPFEKIEALKTDTELQKQVNSTLEAIAGGKGAEAWDSEKIMRQVAASVVLPRMLEKQNEVITGLKTELEEFKPQLEAKDKKIAELESFIQQRYGALPSNEVPSGGSSPDKTDKPIWEDIQIRVG